jgi:hypothetical protein
MAIDFRFFCASVGTLWIFKVYSQEVKTERKLNCNRAHWRCRKICETGNVQPRKQSGLKMHQPQKRLWGIQLRKFSELLECQIRRSYFCFYLCVWHYGSSQAEHTGSSFYVLEVHYIWTWRSGHLICTFGVPCCSSVFTLLLLLVKKLKNSYCSNGGTEKSETASRLLV